MSLLGSARCHEQARADKRGHMTKSALVTGSLCLHRQRVASVGKVCSVVCRSSTMSSYYALHPSSSMGGGVK